MALRKRPSKGEGVVSAVEYGLLVALIVAICVLAVYGLRGKWTNLSSSVKDVIESGPAATGRTQSGGN